MSGEPVFYQTPQQFFIQNEAYMEHKEKFDCSLAILKASEDLKGVLSGKRIDNAEQDAISRIFLKSQVLFSAIVKSCNEGTIEISKILLRSLFENYVNSRFILQHEFGEKFLDYRVAAAKKYCDSYEVKFPHDPHLSTEEYKVFKKKLDEDFRKVKHLYADKNGRILKSWSRYHLRAMSDKMGETLTYDYIMSIYSAYVHCDPGGMRQYHRIENKQDIFDNNPSTKDIDELLTLGVIFFRNIVGDWAKSFNIKVPNVLIDSGSSPE